MSQSLETSNSNFQTQTPILQKREQLAATDPAQSRALAQCTQQGIRCPANDHRLRVIPGPEYDDLTQPIKEQFWQSNWVLSGSRSRQGIHLESPNAAFRDAALGNSSSMNNTSRINASRNSASKNSAPAAISDSMRSHAVLPGTIQLPPSMRPIILNVGCQTTGGYPRIATIIAADMWKLFHPLNNKTLRFDPVDSDTAINALKQQQTWIYRARLANQVALTSH